MASGDYRPVSADKPLIVPARDAELVDGGKMQLRVEERRILKL